MNETIRKLTVIAKVGKVAGRWNHSVQIRVNGECRWLVEFQRGDARAVEPTVRRIMVEQGDFPPYCELFRYSLAEYCERNEIEYTCIIDTRPGVDHLRLTRPIHQQAS